MFKHYMHQWATLDGAQCTHHCKVFKIHQEKHKRNIAVRDSLIAYNQKKCVRWQSSKNGPFALFDLKIAIVGFCVPKLQPVYSLMCVNHQSFTYE
jgi:hypothetical protein